MPTPADAPTLDLAKLLDRLWNTLMAHDVAATVELREQFYDAAMELHIQLHAALLEASRDAERWQYMVKRGWTSAETIDEHREHEAAWELLRAARSSGETTPDQPALYQPK